MPQDKSHAAVKGWRKVEALLDEEKWKEARRLLHRMLRQHPDNHLVLTSLALTYYEEYGYQRALELSEKAYALAPECPNVVWDYAGALDMLDRDQEAIRLYRWLVKRPIATLANGDCGQGVRFARSLQNDSLYRLGRCYAHSGRMKDAIRHVEAHIAGRKQGISSIYNLRTVRRELAMLQAGEVP